MNLGELKAAGEAPEWMGEEGYKTLCGGYLLPNETPRQAYWRVAHAAASYYADNKKWQDKFFEVMWKNWLCPASPVLSNMGTDRGLPISCNSIHVGDSVNSIFGKSHELAMLSKNGAGVGIYLGDVRGRGSAIRGNGKSEGVIPWAKVYDTTTVSVSQGCYDKDTELLTELGWLKFEELKNKPNLKVAQSSNKGEITFVNFTDYIEYETDEDLYRLNGTSSAIDLLVTGNHRMAIERRKRVSNKRDSKGNFLNNEKLLTGYLDIVLAEKLNLHRDNLFWVAAKTCVGKLEKLTDEDRFRIAYQADGSTKSNGNSTGRISNNITYVFHFKKERKILRLSEIVTRLGWEFTINYQKDGSSNILVKVPVTFKISKNLKDVFEISKFSKVYAEEFVKEISYWDGHITENDSVQYSCIIKDNVDFVQAASFIAGKMSSMRVYENREGNRKDIYSIFICNRNSVGGENLTLSKEYYKGKVFCVTVKEGLLVVRRNGKVAICGNSTRRGASAVYLPIEHADIEEFINIRRPTGDMNRRCLNLNHGICISDEWMLSAKNGDKDKRHLWQEILRARVETGEPYLFFSDNVNKQNPECYTKNGLQVKTSNICCVSGDTLIATKSGPKPIAELVGTEVEIWDGINWVKNNTFEKRGEDILYRMKIKDGSYVDSNANHRWFVAHSYQDIKSNKYSLCYTKDLKPGMFVEYHNQEFHGERSNEPGAYLKGFLVGDGTHVKDIPLLRLNRTKYVCENSLIISCKEIPVKSIAINDVVDVGFLSEYNCTETLAMGQQISKNMQGLTVRKKELLSWTNEYKHEMPSYIYEWTKEIKLKFLAGLFDANGVINKNNDIEISSISFKFIQQLQLLLKTLACSSSIEVCNNKDCNPIYRLNISAFDSYNLLNQMPTHRLKIFGPRPNRNITEWQRIESIEALEGLRPVYCPNLPTTGKFGLANGLMTGNTEIFLYTDPNHSFVCCLSSLNLVKFDEWKDSDLVETTVRFLDAVLEEYIRKSDGIAGLEASRLSAIKGRAIGIGVLGWHTYLQKRMIPFDSFQAMMSNSLIFKTIREKAEKETKVLAEELGEPEWCKGFGRRNTHLLAVAPTVSNSTISGGHSAGIEPWAANVFSQKSAKGTFIRKNSILEALLESKGQNTPEVWKIINEQSGSVMTLSCLTNEEKQVFLTAREINQFAIIKQAAQRQKFIDQGQSVNLFFAANANPQYIHEVHMEAWKSGLKSLYYLRTEGVLRGDLASRSKEECSSCEG